MKMNYTEFMAFVKTEDRRVPGTMAKPKLLSETIKFFDEIVELDFSNCNLTRLPEETPWCNNLQVLNCANNKLTFLEDGFVSENGDGYPNHVISMLLENGVGVHTNVYRSDYYKNLTHLDCSNNQLTDLPESIKNSEKLEYVDVSNNVIPEHSFKGRKIWELLPSSAPILK